jgi:Mn2+/Fe2+ NRAMP family transporter
MAFSNLIGVAIITTTATTLHANGKTNIETSAQAAEALRPLAGVFAETIFALGIIGTGLLAIPVLAGSTAYAIGEGRKWPVGLSRKPKKAVAFYAVLAVSVFLGIGLNFTPLDPIKALYWSAVVNGVLAPPVMVLLMLLVRKQKVMPTFMPPSGISAIVTPATRSGPRSAASLKTSSTCFRWAQPSDAGSGSVCKISNCGGAGEAAELDLAGTLWLLHRRSIASFTRLT